MKPTPGPWEVVGTRICTIGNDHTRRTLARMDGREDFGAEDANARLIAAAPELLEALRAMLDMVTDNRTHGPEIDKACAAIAKAEGVRA